MTYKKDIKKVVLILVVIVYPYLPIIKEWNSQNGMIIEAILLVALALASMLKIKDNTIKLLVRNQVVILEMFLIIYFFGNTSNMLSSFSGLRSMLLYVLFYSLIYDDEKRREHYTMTAAKATVGASLVMAVGCIIQFVYPSIIKSAHNPKAWDMLRAKTDWKALGIYNRALSFMTDPNVLSVYLAFALFLTIVLYKNSRNKRYVKCAVIQIIAIILTQSRTGMFVVVLFALFSAFFNLVRTGKLSRKILMFIMLIISLVPIFIMQYWNKIATFLRVDTLLDGNGRAGKTSIHVVKYFSDTISLFLGHGLFDGREIIFENTYLAVLYMFGVFGTCIFLFLTFRVFYPLVIKESIEIILCYAAAIFVGDYILIPQVTMVTILVLICNRCYISNKNNENGMVKQ